MTHRRYAAGLGLGLLAALIIPSTVVVAQECNEFRRIYEQASLEAERLSQMVQQASQADNAAEQAIRSAETALASCRQTYARAAGQCGDEENGLQTANRAGVAASQNLLNRLNARNSQQRIHVTARAQYEACEQRRASTPPVVPTPTSTPVTVAPQQPLPPITVVTPQLVQPVPPITVVTPKLVQPPLTQPPLTQPPLTQPPPPQQTHTGPFICYYTDGTQTWNVTVPANTMCPRIFGNPPVHIAPAGPPPNMLHDPRRARIAPVVPGQPHVTPRVRERRVYPRVNNVGMRHVERRRHINIVRTGNRRRH